MSKHIVSVLVNNHAGVLSRVSGLFSRRGFNIDSLVVGVTSNKEISRMTIVVDGDDYIVEQVSKQLNKLVDVVKVEILDSSNAVTRESALFKVNATKENRAELIQIVEIFRADIVDIAHTTITIQIIGGFKKVEAFKEMIADFGILETVRTGLIAIERGDKIMEEN